MKIRMLKDWTPKIGNGKNRIIHHVYKECPECSIYEYQVYSPLEQKYYVGHTSRSLTELYQWAENNNHYDIAFIVIEVCNHS